MEKTIWFIPPMQTLGSTIAEAFPFSSVSNTPVCHGATVFFE